MPAPRLCPDRHRLGCYNSPDSSSRRADAMTGMTTDTNVRLRDFVAFAVVTPLAS